ncbi:MAG: hypothetical protein A2Y00_07275 [Omnitrophica WOR_2 bacterium GWF2_43_52]|nr:MAG: hypothetical protein A2062_07505 [Omnitrophica WOR_2 bacterium GWA2_44_7]OGX16666.1 MAG: hypothetical protein A2Y01_00950 [Omnitrophica WOR_2 bacterium GWC2_44_8]OGX20221.1 MAG: hypothetical protein A2Y00_07275 [Omnitrophica WOR_2 bacterium GWF2_43_52]OGX54483.1 MAG: hypothetical protein A2460_03140 [Omnitrophica WOR_2 bacterium RIFOXYC2_FULL_43_9]HAH20760.1 hypothetical protein [Candidatus Omnitrophota bacterium]
MACVTIPGLRYRDFSRSFHYREECRNVPLEGAIEVTNACNLSCRHCYIRDNDTRGELSYTQWRRIIDEIVEEGCLWLTFTGGEPLLRKDFLDIYLYAKRKGLLLVLFTNATLIDRKIAEFLAEYRPFFLEISLYGMSEDVYKSVSGSPEAYYRMKEALALLRERNVLFKLKSVLTKDTIAQIPQMKAFAKGLGLEFRFDLLINPRIDGGKEPCEVRVSPEEGVALEMSDSETAYYMEKDYFGLTQEVNPGLLFPCSAGKNSFNIDSKGRLSICNMVRHINCDLTMMSFKEGWQSFPEILSRKAALNSRCASCNLDSFCNRCPGWAMMEYRDEGALVEYACEVTRAREQVILERRRGNGNKSKEKLYQAELKGSNLDS